MTLTDMSILRQKKKISRALKLEVQIATKKQKSYVILDVTRYDLEAVELAIIENQIRFGYLFMMAKQNDKVKLYVRTKSRLFGIYW
jgi:hypothetical protein